MYQQNNIAVILELASTFPDMESEERNVLPRERKVIRVGSKRCEKKDKGVFVRKINMDTLTRAQIKARP